MLGCIIYPSETTVVDEKGSRVVSCTTEDEAREYILLCYSSRIEENSPCKNNRVEIAKVEDAIMKTVNMYATAYLDEK